MLIRKIDLRNFQAHKKLALDLEQFTAIVGPSSAGKSAILRALYWMFYGDWDATYPNDPELDTSIAIQLENGTIWARFRKGKRNWAMYRKPGEKAMVYQDFGEVIPGLLEELNLRPIRLGTSKINLNFSMQDDPIFMVHESKPAKAQWIGRLYGAHIINAMLRLMSKDKRSIESLKSAAEDEEVRLRQELSKYEGLDEQREAIDRVAELLVRLQQMVECQAQMVSIMQDREAVKKGAHFLEADTDGIRASLTRLSDLIAAQDASLSIQREEWTLGQSKVRNADTASIRESLAQLESVRARLVEYRQVEDAFEEATQSRYAITSRMECLVPRLDDLRKQLKDSMFEEGRCPLCQSKPKKLDMDLVASNLKEMLSSNFGT